MKDTLNLSNNEVEKIQDDKIMNSIVNVLWVNSFFFNSETDLKGWLDLFNKYLESFGLIKLFEAKAQYKDNSSIDSKILSFINYLYVLNKDKFVYSFVFNVSYPWEGVYSFYFNSSINIADSRVYTDWDVYINDIKKVLSMRQDEEYSVSVFSYKPIWWETPILNPLNNIDYMLEKKVA